MAYVTCCDVHVSSTYRCWNTDSMMLGFFRFLVERWTTVSFCGVYLCSVLLIEIFIGSSSLLVFMLWFVSYTRVCAFKSYTTRAGPVCSRITNVIQLEKRKAEKSPGIFFAAHAHLQTALIIVAVTLTLTLYNVNNLIN